MSSDTNELDKIYPENKVDRQIEQFAIDFGIPMESYKYNHKTMVITFHCVDASPSEINRWQWQIPAFVIGGHYKLIATKEQQARIDELIELSKYDHMVAVSLIKDRIKELKGDI